MEEGGNKRIEVDASGRMTDPIAAKMYLSRYRASGDLSDNFDSWVLTRFTDGVRGRSKNVLPDDADAKVL